MTDRILLERIKRGEGLPPIPLKDDECNRSEDFDFIADYPKKDMSKVDCVRVNGKEYFAIDKALEIIDAESWSYCDWLIRERACIGQEKVLEFANKLRDRFKKFERR